MVDRKRLRGGGLPNLLIGTEGLQGAALAKDMLEFAEKFKTQRQVQYNLDRCEALRDMSIEAWQKFSLRWNIAPPYPKGWGNEIAMWIVMHKVRITLIEFNHDEKLLSAKWLRDNGAELPEHWTLNAEGDRLTFTP